jgi:hypothetical protein
MAFDPSTVKRLAFVKYLYTRAVEESKAPEPFAAGSVLRFHDAAEFFLHLASERLGAHVASERFMAYFEEIPKKLGADLTQQEPMRRLSNSRKALKHHGTMPSKLDIEAFRASATSFFEENTPTVFGASWDRISLVDFVEAERARESLRAAEQALERGEYTESLENAACAFGLLLADYERRKEGPWGPTLFNEIDRGLVSLSTPPKLSLPMGAPPSETDRRMVAFAGEAEKWIGRIKDTLRATNEIVKMLALGVDYRRYSKFKLVTPAVYVATDGSNASPNRMRRTAPGTKEHAAFGIEFVIETALALAAADYTLGRDVVYPPEMLPRSMRAETGAVVVS